MSFPLKLSCSSFSLKQTKYVDKHKNSVWFHKYLIYCCYSPFFLSFDIHILNNFWYLQAIKICIENASDVKEEWEFHTSSSLQCKYFLEEVLSIVRESLPHGMLFANFYFSIYSQPLYVCCIIFVCLLFLVQFANKAFIILITFAVITTFLEDSWLDDPLLVAIFLRLSS